jgi:hypothetical protein
MKGMHFYLRHLEMDCCARARNDGVGAEDFGKFTLVLFADAEAAEDGV